jgi:UDP-glucose 4-epimerase
MKNILITGGAGFIGSQVAEICVARGHQVTVLDDLSAGLRANVPRGAELIVGDILNFDVDAIVKEKNISDICHLAAKVSVRNSIDILLEDANVNFIGTLRLIRAALYKGVNSFVFASTMAVYADPPTKKPLAENFTTEPLSPYGVSKLAAEMDLTILLEGSRCRPVALRYFNTYGPGQRLTSDVGVITIFSDLLRQKKAIPIYGDGNQQRDFVSVHDVAEATVGAMENPNARGTFNIGSGSPLSLNQLADMMIGIFGVPATLKTFVPRRHTELTYSVADICRAARELDYSPKHDLKAYLTTLVKGPKR